MAVETLIRHLPQLPDAPIGRDVAPRLEQRRRDEYRDYARPEGPFDRIALDIIRRRRLRDQPEDRAPDQREPQRPVPAAPPDPEHEHHRRRRDPRRQRAAPMRERIVIMMVDQQMKRSEEHTSELQPLTRTS